MTLRSSKPPFHTSRTFAVAVVLLSAIGYSTKAIFAKLAYAHGMTPLPLLTLRMLCSAPFFALILLLSSSKSHRPLSGQDHLYCILLGILGLHVSALLDFQGLRYVSAGLERTILFAYPTIVTILNFLFLGTRPTKLQVVALSLTYIGIAIPFASEWNAAGDDVLLGALLVAGCAVCFALYIVGGGRLIKTMGSPRFTSIVLLWSTISLVLHSALVLHPNEFAPPQEAYSAIIMMAIFSTVLPALMLSFGIARLGGSTAAILSSIGPVSTIALSAAILGEPITFSDIIGVVLVVSGVVLIAKEREEHSAS